MALARLIRTVAGIVAAKIVAEILMRLLGDNPHNTVDSDIHYAGAWLVGPFKTIFSVGSAKASMAVNWGLAAIVYLAVAHVLASLIARGTPRRGVGRVRSAA